MLPDFSGLVVKRFIAICHALALPSGELSPQVTERVLQLFENLQYFPLSDLAALGHLSQRERRGMLGKYAFHLSK